jgi:hypothetical protein
MAGTIPLRLLSARGTHEIAAILGWCTPAASVSPANGGGNYGRLQHNILNVPNAISTVRWRLIAPAKLLDTIRTPISLRVAHLTERI